MKDGYKYVLPGIINSLYNPYNLEVYRKTKSIANFLKGSSDIKGIASSWALLLGKNVLSKRLGYVSLIFQLGGSSLDFINSMSIGEQKEAFNNLTDDVVSTGLGEFLTKSKAGEVMEAAGFSTFYDQIKEGLRQNIEKVKK